MLISKIRGDGVFDGTIEMPDDTTKLQPGYSFSLPPTIPNGYYAVLSGGWNLIKGDKPEWPRKPSKEEQLQILYSDIVTKTQQRLDNFARSREYDGILSACTYASSTIEKFRNEGSYCIEMRDLTWNKLYEMLDEVKNGTRPAPNSYEDIESELPILNWPS